MLQGPRLVHAKLNIPDLKYSSPRDHQATWASAFSSNRKAPTLLLEPAWDLSPAYPSCPCKQFHLQPSPKTGLLPLKASLKADIGTRALGAWPGPPCLAGQDGHVTHYKGPHSHNRHIAHHRSGCLVHQFPGNQGSWGRDAFYWFSRGSGPGSEVVKAGRSRCLGYGTTLRVVGPGMSREAGKGVAWLQTQPHPHDCLCLDLLFLVASHWARSKWLLINRGLQEAWTVGMKAF